MLRIRSFSLSYATWPPVKSYCIQHLNKQCARFASCYVTGLGQPWVDCVWNVMALAYKPDFVFRRNGRVNLNRQGRQFSRLLAAELCASAVVMLDTPCSEVVWRVLATHSIRQFPLYFPSRASPCAITFQLESTTQSPHDSPCSYFRVGSDI